MSSRNYELEDLIRNLRIPRLQEVHNNYCSAVDQAQRYVYLTDCVSKLLPNHAVSEVVNALQMNNFSSRHEYFRLDLIDDKEVVLGGDLRELMVHVYYIAKCIEETGDDLGNPAIASFLEGERQNV